MWLLFCVLVDLASEIQNENKKFIKKMKEEEEEEK